MVAVVVVVVAAVVVDGMGMRCKGGGAAGVDANGWEACYVEVKCMGSGRAADGCGSGGRLSPNCAWGCPGD